MNPPSYVSFLSGYDKDIRIIYRQDDRGLARYGPTYIFLRWVTREECIDSHTPYNYVGQVPAAKETLIHTVALRIANHVPSDLICSELTLTEAELKKLTGTALYKRLHAANLAKSTAIATETAFLTQDEIKQEARNAFETIKENAKLDRGIDPDTGLPRPMSTAERALAQRSAEYILKASGLGEIQKSEHTTKSTQITIEGKAAEKLVEALAANQTRTIIDVPFELIQSGEHDDLVDPTLATQMEVTDRVKERIQGEGHSGDADPQPQTGEDN
jgi:hypothetical protein